MTQPVSRESHLFSLVEIATVKLKDRKGLERSFLYIDMFLPIISFLVNKEMSNMFEHGLFERKESPNVLEGEEI